MNRERKNLVDMLIALKKGEIDADKAIVTKFATIDNVESKGDDDIEAGLLAPSEFTISTAARDRDGDVIQPKGWDLEAYKKNPVIMWAHDYSQPPVGKALSTVKSNDALKQTVDWISRDVSPFAFSIGRMVKQGFLNATSVGFKPKEFDMLDGEDVGFEFRGQELLENSIVPIPSNPEALVEARSVGIETAPVRKWAEQVLDGELFLPVPQSVIEAVRKSADEKSQVAIYFRKSGDGVLDVTFDKDDGETSTESEESKGREDAPNLRVAGEEDVERCRACRFFTGEGVCELYDFSPNGNEVCDSFEAADTEEEDVDDVSDSDATESDTGTKTVLTKDATEVLANLQGALEASLGMVNDLASMVAGVDDGEDKGVEDEDDILAALSDALSSNDAQDPLLHVAAGIASLVESGE